jgi:hypothetical protein
VAASFLARALSSGHLQVQTHGNLQALLRAMALQSALMKMTTETKIRTVWERDLNHHLHSGSNGAQATATTRAAGIRSSMSSVCPTVGIERVLK